MSMPRGDTNVLRVIHLIVFIHRSTASTSQIKEWTIVTAKQDAISYLRYPRSDGDVLYIIPEPKALATAHCANWAGVWEGAWLSIWAEFDATWSTNDSSLIATRWSPTSPVASLAPPSCRNGQLAQRGGVRYQIDSASWCPSRRPLTTLFLDDV